MQIRVHVRHASPTDALKRYIVERLEAALSRAVRRVREVEVWIVDENGPRGGADKHCRVAVALAGHAPVIAEAVSPDVYDAVREAAHLSKHSVMRSLHRRRLR